MSNTFLSKFIYKRVPLFISYIFHPLLLPTIGVYIILNSGTYISMMPAEAKNYIILLVATCTFGLPIAFLPFFSLQKNHYLARDESDTGTHYSTAYYSVVLLFVLLFIAKDAGSHHNTNIHPCLCHCCNNNLIYYNKMENKCTHDWHWRRNWFNCKLILPSGC